MRVVFFGTSSFAVPTLDALHDVAERHEILAVVTQPDRPSGRGMQLSESPVKKRAVALGYEILQPERVRRKPFPATIAALAPDILVVVSFGQIIPQGVLDSAPHGGINVHASLLPRWRGAAPIHRAILAGDSETGVATMRMEATLDTGPILKEARLPIEQGDTTLSLEPRLAQIGARLLIETLDALTLGPIDETVQSETGATYASMLAREDGLIDPQTESATQAENRVRALSPRPGAWISIDGRTLKVLECAALPAPDSVSAGPAVPGTIGSLGRDGIDIVCADGGILRLISVQPPGKPILPADAWSRGARITLGTVATKPADI